MGRIVQQLIKIFNTPSLRTPSFWQDQRKKVYWSESRIIDKEENDDLFNKKFGIEMENTIKVKYIYSEILKKKRIVLALKKIFLLKILMKLRGLKLLKLYLIMFLQRQSMCYN